jgi:hypothetical protein
MLNLALEEAIEKRIFCRDTQLKSDATVAELELVLADLKEIEAAIK